MDVDYDCNFFMILNFVLISHKEDAGMTPHYELSKSL